MGERQMSNPPCMALLSSLAETLGPPGLYMSDVKFGGTYRRILPNNPSMLDPPHVTNIHGRAVVLQIFDGLVHFDAYLKPLPALAEFWEASRDGRTWTFTLGRGVMFHHGWEVTTHYVVSSFTRLLDPQKRMPVTEIFAISRG